MDILARYSGLKTRARETRDYLTELLSSSLTNQADSKLLIKAVSGLNECANYLVFHDYYTVEQRKLVKASTCKQGLLCPFCAARRASKNVQAHGEKITNLMTGRKDLIPVMITFTVKNQSDLPSVYKHMNKSLKRLMDRRKSNKCHGTHKTEMSKVAGAIASREITFNDERGDWHPHVHMIALLTDYIDQEKLSNEWLEITGDSKIVGVSLIKKNQKKTTNTDLNPLVSGLLEVFKYALKFGDLPQEKLWEAYKYLRGKRLVTSYGDLYGVHVPESLLDDPLDDLPYIELFYQYSKKTKNYNLKTHKVMAPRTLQESPFTENINSYDVVEQRPKELKDLRDQRKGGFEDIDQEAELLGYASVDVFGRMPSTRRTRVKLKQSHQT